MIEILDIRLSADLPGAYGWVGEVRLIDKSKGYKDTEFGPMLKWDKFFSVASPFQEVMVEKLEERLTEELCHK